MVVLCVDAFDAFNTFNKTGAGDIYNLSEIGGSLFLMKFDCMGC